MGKSSVPCSVRQNSLRLSVKRNRDAFVCQEVEKNSTPAESQVSRHQLGSRNGSQLHRCNNHKR